MALWRWATPDAEATSRKPQGPDWPYAEVASMRLAGEHHRVSASSTARKLSKPQ